MRRQGRQNRRQRQRTPAETIKGRTDSGNPGTNGLFEPDGKTPGSAGLGGGGWFCNAAARRLNFGALHQIIQSWILTFPDMATLDAQFDEAKIAMGEIRSIKELTASEWSEYWGAVQYVPDRSGGQYLPGRPWRFSAEQLTPIGTPAFQGEHNVAVFSDLGISEAELKRLSETGALVTHRRALESRIAAKPESEPGQAA